MRCKFCKMDVPDGAAFCCWCGRSLQKSEIKIPAARQLPSGKWNIQLRGEGISITEDTRAKAEAKARAIRAGFVEKTKKNAHILKTACEKYISDAEGRIDATTAEGYRKIVRNQFPELMQTRIDKITQQEAQHAINAECRRNSRRGKPYSPKTICNGWFFISSVLEHNGVKLDVTLPETQDRPVVILKPEDVYRAVRGTEIELPCLLAMWLSLSMSEIKGITKSRSIIDGKLYITETVVNVNGVDVRREKAKEERRQRVYDIPPALMERIDAVETDVIAPKSGQAMYKRLSRLLAKNGLPHISFHRLRHINASVMAELNIPDKTANERGGWKTDYTRKRVYTHVFDESRKNADAAINDYFANVIANEGK